MAVGDVVAGEPVDPDHPLSTHHGQHGCLDLGSGAAGVSVRIHPTGLGGEHCSDSVNLDSSPFAS